MEISPLILVQKENNKENIIDKICKIGRSSNANIKINNCEISKNHAEINLMDSNYYLKDNGSTNGTFIKIFPEKQLKIEKGMIFNLESIYLLILDISKKSIILRISRSPYYVDYKISKIKKLYGLFGQKNKIVFGKNPKESDDNNIIKIDFDKKIDDELGIFTFDDYEDCFYIETMAMAISNIYFKLEKNGISKLLLFQLYPNVEISLNEVTTFIVKNGPILKLEKCIICNKVRNSAYSSCLHSRYCFDCATNIFINCKICSICGNKIQDVQEIIFFKDKNENRIYW